MSSIPMIKLGVASGVVGFAGMFAFLSLTQTPAHADGLGLGDASADTGGGAGGDSGPPPLIELTGVVRDFRERTAEGGHPDFERQPNSGWGHYAGNVAAFLGDDNKPVFTGEGRKVLAQWQDAEGNQICHCLEPVDGDEAGSWGASDTASTESEDSFNQWFNDTPGVNQSSLLTITLHRQEDGTYVFDDKDDPAYSSLGGFFPIEGMLFGNPGGSPDRNFHFTYELHTEFVYKAEEHQNFRFIGDDDVWVFIDGNLVIDLGGVHAAIDQTIELNRLGLEDGEEYTLDFFFAERHRTQSNFRIQTNIDLTSIKVPSVTAAFD